MIAVYGATGYTGRLVAEELARRGLKARLCGRNGGKLRALKASLGVDWDVRAAAVDDTPALRKAFDGASVVLSCAGPFTYYGAPVIEAALAAGAHYCDTTGEQPYMKRVFDFLDAPARERGVAVVPAVGFDYVPGDLAASLAARGREPLEEMLLAYVVEGFGATRGTMHSALEMLRGGDLEYVDGDWRPASGAIVRERFAFGDGLGEQALAPYPGGEIVTVPRHVKTRAVRQRLAASFLAPHPSLASVVPFTVPVMATLLNTPLRDLADAVIDRLPEGPSDDARRASRFTITAVARGEDGEESRVVVRGSDVYGLTAVMAVEIARTMGEDGFSESGALAPAQVVDAAGFLDFLGDHGVSYDAPAPAKRAKKAPAGSGARR